MKKGINSVIFSVAMITIILVMALLANVSAENYIITIEADPSYPGWSDYDYAVGTDDIHFTPEKTVSGEDVIISADIHNSGLCKACSAWGWWSPAGRSCWGEWDFEYPRSEVVDISFRAADNAPGPGATYRIELDGVYLGDAQVPATTSWYLITIHNVTITAGNHTIFLGTYQMDFYPDIHLDYIQIGSMRIEAENYDRMGGNDPNPDWRGLSVYPRDIVVQFWDGNPRLGGVLISEQVVGKVQLVIDSGHQYPGYTYYAHYIENDGIATATTVWTPTIGTHDIYVLIDPNNVLGEVNESNNIAYKEITVGIPANVTIKPETLNLPSKGLFTAFITLPKPYNITDVNISTVVCEGAPAVQGMIADDNKYMAKFDREDLVGVEPGDAVTLTVTGKLYDGTPFEGSDTIRVID